MPGKQISTVFASLLKHNEIERFLKLSVMAEEKWIMYDNNTQMRICCTIWGKVYSDAKRRDTICLVLLQPNKTIGSNFPCQQLTIGKESSGTSGIIFHHGNAGPHIYILSVPANIFSSAKRLNGGNSVPIERCKNHLDNCSPRNYRGSTVTEWWCYRDGRTLSSLVLIF